MYIGAIVELKSLYVLSTYSCARVFLVLQREYSYYLIQLYIPSFMLVVVSWVSFWLDKDAVPARVSLGVTTLLTMTTQASGVNAKLPPVSYTKAVDVWIGVCLAFIFGALLEYAVVNYAGRIEFMAKETDKKRQTQQGGLTTQSNTPIHTAGLVINPSGKQSLEDSNPLDILPGVSVAIENDSTGNNVLVKRHSAHTTESGIIPLDASHDPTPPAYSGCPECEHEMHQQHLVPITKSSDMCTPSWNTWTAYTRPLMPQLLEMGAHSVMRVQPNTGKHRVFKFNGVWSLITKYKERSKRIDVVSRILFPIGFFLFNCMYWTRYLAMPNTEQENQGE